MFSGAPLISQTKNFARKRALKSDPFLITMLHQRRLLSLDIRISRETLRIRIAETVVN